MYMYIYILKYIYILIYIYIYIYYLYIYIYIYVYIFDTSADVRESSSLLPTFSKMSGGLVHIHTRSFFFYLIAYQNTHVQQDLVLTREK